MTKGDKTASAIGAGMARARRSRRLSEIDMSPSGSAPLAAASPLPPGRGGCVSAPGGCGFWGAGPTSPSSPVVVVVPLTVVVGEGETVVVGAGWPSGCVVCVGVGSSSAANGDVEVVGVVDTELVVDGPMDEDVVGGVVVDVLGVGWVVEVVVDVEVVGGFGTVNGQVRVESRSPPTSAISVMVTS